MSFQINYIAPKSSTSGVLTVPNYDQLVLLALGLHIAGCAVDSVLENGQATPDCDLGSLHASALILRKDLNRCIEEGRFERCIPEKSVF